MKLPPLSLSSSVHVFGLPDFWPHHQHAVIHRLTESESSGSRLAQNPDNSETRLPETPPGITAAWAAFKTTKSGKSPLTGGVTVKRTRPSKLGESAEDTQWLSSSVETGWILHRQTECATAFRKLLQTPARYVGSISSRAQDIRSN